MEVRSLPSSPYLNQLRKPLSSPRYKEITEYAKYAVKTLLPKESDIYGSLRLNIFEGIFINGKSVAEITQKKYSACSGEQIGQLMYWEFLGGLCGGKTIFIYPVDSNREYMLISPKKITAELTGEAKGLERVRERLKRGQREKSLDKYFYKAALKRQEELELKLGGALMNQALKNQSFVTRFNEETFFKNTDLSQLAEDRLGIKERTDILSFVILYSVSFFGLKYNEIFTVDDVFGFSDNGIRSKDNVKTSAAAALGKDLQRCGDMQLGSMLELMGQALCEIPLPKLNCDVAAKTALNYVLYSAAAQTGNVFLKIIRGESKPAKCYSREYEFSYGKAEDRAELLSDYKYAAKLCEEIRELLSVKGRAIYNAHSYNDAKELQKRVRDEENAVI